MKRQLLTWLALVVWLGGVPAGGAPGYRILVSSESGDIVSQLTWDGAALKTVKVVPVGIMPADIDGPHNVTVSPDGRYWYVTIAHGTPYGTLWKMAVDGDTLVGKAPVEMFPTTISLTPDGELAFVANSDFHGDHPRMNVVSIVYTPQMVTLTNLPACDMPHGVKVNHAGTKVYVTCMNSDEVLEIDRPSLAITRRHRTGEGMLPQAMPMKMGHGGAQGTAAMVHDACMPTFVSVSPDDARLYVACNHSDELMVLDARTLELVKTIPTG
ncbi:MAG TPA: YncE family protein, partial [Gemmatimonadales bacterium]|nr:YncE family protein [Gemmatimonadales bacterium]